VSERPGLRFGRVADEYERVRPTYPAALVDEGCSRAGLQSGDTVVEIGCGTGKLTRALVERGLRVEAVEPDAELIEMARRILPEGSVRFHLGTFEEVELAPRAFPAVFAATSFHWVDPATGWRKVASLLRPDAVFALLSHAGGMRGNLYEELLRVWEEVSPAADAWRPIDDETLWRGAEERTANVSQLWSWLTRHDELAVPEAADLFRDVRFAKEAVDRTFSADDYIRLTRTTNNYLHLAPGDQQRLDKGLSAVFEAHGGTYHATGLAVLVTARRT
jgi:SAM-dependent methyltransferase